MCSADDKWVYYWNLELQQLWRAALNGSGKPELVPRSVVPRTVPAGTGLSLSPDGRVLAYMVATVTTPEDPYPQYKVAFLNLLSADAPLQLIDADERISTSGLSFTPDGKAVVYPIRESGVDNLWVQPIDGAQGKQLTSFTAEQIFAFHWSPDGKSLGLLRGHTDSDVVLIKESARVAQSSVASDWSSVVGVGRQRTPIVLRTGSNPSAFRNPMEDPRPCPSNKRR